MGGEVEPGRREGRHHPVRADFLNLAVAAIRYKNSTIVVAVGTIGAVKPRSARTAIYVARNSRQAGKIGEGISRGYARRGALADATVSVRRIKIAGAIHCHGSEISKPRNIADTVRAARRHAEAPQRRQHSGLRELPNREVVLVRNIEVAIGAKRYAGLVI